MNKSNSLILLISILISACGINTEKSTEEQGNKETESSGQSSAVLGMKETSLTTSIGGETYDLIVSYHLSEEDGLTVYSDKNDVTDSNGDGIILAIFEYNKKLQFDFVKEGERIGGRITDWNNTGSAISGSGDLLPESGLGQKTPVKFKMDL